MRPPILEAALSRNMEIKKTWIATAAWSPTKVDGRKITGVRQVMASSIVLKTRVDGTGFSSPSSICLRSAIEIDNTERAIIASTSVRLCMPDTEVFSRMSRTVAPSRNGNGGCQLMK